MDFLRQHKIQISRLCLLISCVFFVFAVYTHISVFYFHIRPPVLDVLFLWPWYNIGLISIFVAVLVGPSGYNININQALPRRTRRIAGWVELGIFFIYLTWTLN